MSAPLTDLPSSISSSGHVDGLGRRLLAIDRETGAMMERLRLRPELCAFESALRHRIDELAHFEDERFARPFSIQRDPESGELSVLSEFVAGSRLSDLLETAHEAGLVPGVDVALGFLLEALPALSTFHATTGGAHGLVDPTRMVITPAGQIVFLDCAFAAVVERLGLSRSRLWTELGFASTPPSSGPVRHDVVADISQAALSAVMLVLGRRLGEDEYPDALPALLIEVVDVAQIRGSHLFASGLQRLLQRSLPLPGRRPFTTAIEALEEVRQLLRREIGLTACHQALVDFTEQTDTAFSTARGGADDEQLAEDAEEEYAPRASRNTMMIDSSALDAFGAIEILDDAGDPRAEIEEEEEEDSDEPSLEVELSLDDEVVAPAPPQFVITADPEPELLIDDPEPLADAPRAPFQPAIAPAPVEPAPVQLAVETAPVDSAEIAAAHSTNDEERAATEDQSGVSSRRLKRQQHKSARARKDKLRSTTAPPPEPAPAPPPAAPPVAKAEPAKATASGWLVSPDRAAKFEPPVPDPPPPVVPALGHTIPPPPVYYPPPQTPTPPPHARVPVVAPPVKPAIPMPVFGAPAPPPAAPPPPAPPPAPVRVQAPVAPVQPVQRPTAPVPLRMKADAPAGYVPTRSRDAMAPPLDRGPSFETPEPRPFPWKLAAAAILIVAGAIVVGRAYIPSNRATPVEPKTVAQAPAPEAAAPVAAAPAAGKGDINIETQPAGAKVLLDGKAVGESPLKLTGIPSGRHILTFISTSGEVMKTVRVPSGKTVTVDVAIFSGWVAIFAPIVLEVSENGKSLGTTEVNRIMLPPGPHELTLVNRDLGYKAVQEVTVDAGEVRSITVEPKGTVNFNAVPWAEVWLDGEKLGDTPLANMRVPLGVREFVFKHPQHGEKKVTVTVRADEPAAVSADFTR
jgi:hypothetical protein